MPQRHDAATRRCVSSQLIERTIDHAHRDQLAAALGLLKDLDGDSFDSVSSTHDDQCRTRLGATRVSLLNAVSVDCLNRRVARADDPVVPTPDEIEAARTPAGGWTRNQLAAWGVPWPPPKGWRERLEDQSRRRAD